MEVDGQVVLVLRRPFTNGRLQERSSKGGVVVGFVVLCWSRMMKGTSRCSAEAWLDHHPPLLLMTLLSELSNKRLDKVSSVQKLFNSNGSTGVLVVVDLLLS